MIGGEIQDSTVESRAAGERQRLEAGNWGVGNDNRPDPSGAWSPEPPEEEEPYFPEEATPKADLTQARLLATEPRPAGFGEVLVTDVWSHPPPRPLQQPFGSATFDYAQDKQGEQTTEATEEPEAWHEERAPDLSESQKRWAARQEVRELGLLRERPMVSYDGRFEVYWKHVKEAMGAARNAIVDPYTNLVAEFADVELEHASEHASVVREYGREAEALLWLARGHWAIGRNKAAQTALETAAKAEPQHPSVWYNLGVVRLLSRANKGARQALAEAADQAPGDFRTELALGVACYHLRDYVAAEEHFRRLVGSSGLRATARSMLACSQRMQGNWDDARVELAFLKDAKPGDWDGMTGQCLDCIERGEQKVAGALRKRRQGAQMWRALAGVLAGAVWIAYSAAENLFKREKQWAIIPLFLLVMFVVRSLRRISGAELPGEFGNLEQGLICWQATTWMRHRRSEF